MRDAADVDIDAEGRPDPAFSLVRLLGEFRKPLLLGLVLVVLDSVASLLGPILVKTGIDSGVQAGSRDVLFVASAVFLVVTLADLVDQIGETFVTGRVAQRVMLSLRVRVWAQLQRLSLDFYEREMAGRIMTRMTTDVDQFESLIENGLLSALVSFVTFVGVGVALLVVDLELALCTLTVVVPLAFATVVFRSESARLYDHARERIAIVNADFQESLSGVRESQAFVHEDASVGQFQSLGQATTSTSGSPRSGWSRPTSRSCSSCPPSPTRSSSGWAPVWFATARSRPARSSPSSSTSTCSSRPSSSCPRSSTPGSRPGSRWAGSPSSCGSRP